MGNLSSMAPWPQQRVATVDLHRYAGKWYQVAALPTWFQASDSADAGTTTATYTYESDADGPLLRVLNESVTTAGAKRAIAGVARPDYSCIALPQPEDGDTVPGCLLVKFTPSTSSPIVSPFAASYWVLELADDYRYAVVGTPKRDMLWLLSRQTYLSEADWRHVRRQLLKEHGYTEEQLRRLVWTAHYRDEPNGSQTKSDLDSVQL